MRRRVKVTERMARTLEGIWLPISARLDGAWHLIRGHRVRWYKDPDPWIGLFGWIYCQDCPDTPSAEEDPESDGRGLYIWVRQWNWFMKLAQWWCGRQGHPGEVKRCTQWLGNYDAEGEMLMEEIDTWYCGRCVADVPRPPGRAEG